jgi:hypothetical protein
LPVPLIRLLAPTKIQASTYAEGQVVLFPNDLAADMLSSGFGEAVEDAPVFVEHINRIEPDPDLPPEELPGG